MEPTKKLLVDAISGTTFGSFSFANKMEKLGIAEFCGNQWNTDWRWKKSVLLTLDEQVLEQIYLEGKSQ